MSAYLDRLKQLDGKKYFHHAPVTLPTKPSKAPFVGFDGTGMGHGEKFIALFTSIVPKPSIDF